MCGQPTHVYVRCIRIRSSRVSIPQRAAVAGASSRTTATGEFLQLRFSIGVTSVLGRYNPARTDKAAERLGLYSLFSQPTTHLILPSQPPPTSGVCRKFLTVKDLGSVALFMNSALGV